MRRKWTSKEDEILRRFHAEGKWSNRALADIIGWSEPTVYRKRKKLGLPNIETRGGMRKGCKWSAEARERLSERMKQRMQNPEVREAWMKSAWKGNRNRWKAHTYLPPKDTPERKLYRKLQASLGSEAARQELGYG